MPEEQTSQEAVEQTSQTPAQEASPTGEQSAPAEESREAVLESLTSEQIEEYQQLRRDYEPAVAKITEQGQELARLREQHERTTAALSQLMGQQAAQQDPLLAAEQELREAMSSGDEDRWLAANRQMAQITANRAAQEAEQRAYNRMIGERQLQEAQAFGQYTPEQLNQAANSLTLKDIALVQAYREGRLPQVLDQQRQQSELEKRKGEFFQSTLMAGEGSAGTGLAAPQSGGPKVMHSTAWYSGTTDQQQKMLEDNPDLVLIDDSSPREVKYMKPIVRGQE